MNSSSFLFWLMPAILLFWALGAYNRLVRLRAQVIAAFAAVDQRLTQILTLAAERAAVPPRSLADGDTIAVPLQEPSDAGLDGLRGASIQCEVALRVARRSPLDGPSIAALRTACATMQVSWARLLVPGDEAQAAIQRAWEDNHQAGNEAQALFNQAVATYNGAIAQFPAVVLAYFFGFRAAESL
jgi:LemA protein